MNFPKSLASISPLFLKWERKGTTFFLTSKFFLNFSSFFYQSSSIVRQTPLRKTVPQPPYTVTGPFKAILERQQSFRKKTDEAKIPAKQDQMTRKEDSRKAILSFYYMLCSALLHHAAHPASRHCRSSFLLWKINDGALCSKEHAGYRCSVLKSYT